MTLTVPTFLTALGMIGGLLVFAGVFGRWAGELQTMTKRHDEEIIGLRRGRHDADQNIAVLEQRADTHEQDIGELFLRRKGDR